MAKLLLLSMIVRSSRQLPEGEEALELNTDKFFRDLMGEDEDGNRVIHIKRRGNIKALLQHTSRWSRKRKKTKRRLHSPMYIFSLSEEETEKKEIN